MPRLCPMPKSEVTDPLTLSIYERLFDGRDPVIEPGTATGTPGDWWTVLARAPHVLEHFVLASRMYLGPKMTLSPQLRELGQTRAGWLNGCRFVYSQHCKMARGAGLTAEQVEAIAAWQVADCFDDQQRSVLAYVDYLIEQKGRVPDAIFAKLKSHLSEVEIIELTYVTCCYVGYSILTRALRLEFDDMDDPVIEIPAPTNYGGQDFMGGDRPS
jgi:AhpD family alkylhydroperoxidase